MVRQRQYVQILRDFEKKLNKHNIICYDTPAV